MIICRGVKKNSGPLLLQSLVIFPIHSFVEKVSFGRRWWCLAGLTAAALVFPVRQFYFLIAFFTFIACGIVFTIGTGRTARSRFMMIMCWFIAGLAVTSGLLALYLDRQ